MIIPPKIVLLGGGTGSFTLLQGLKKLTPYLTAIVNMSDNGGSTGALRDEYGVLPPGDIRQCLVALSDSPSVRDLFNYRFSSGSFKGQSLGNIILSGLELQHGSFEKAVEVAGDILQIHGSVVPVTLINHDLVMQDGKVTVHGEANIGKHRILNEDVSLKLEPKSAINPEAEAAIAAADLVIIAPGNFYGSLIPICLVDGLATTLQHTKAQVVSVTNLVNKPGQTDGWYVSDFVEHLEEYLGDGAIDIILFNDKPISDELLKKYAADGEFPVAVDENRLSRLKARAVGAALVSPVIAAQDPADTAIRRTLIRHDADAVCKQIVQLLG